MTDQRSRESYFRDAGGSVAVVLQHDQTFAKHRPALPGDKAAAPQPATSQSPHGAVQDNRATTAHIYDKFRRQLLLKQLKHSQLLTKKPGDRKYDYVYERELLLSARFPQRNDSLTVAKQNKSKARRPRRGSDASDAEEAERIFLEEEAKFEASSAMSPTDLNRPRRRRPREWLDNSPLGAKVADIYAFTGMHHIFTHHTKAVTRVLFANDERGLLAMASVDNTVSIADAMNADPNSTLQILKEHTAAITDMDWSLRNDFLLTSSLDATLRVWDSRTGQCIRTIEGPSPVLCCNFHLINNNLIISGEKSGSVNVYNFSTAESMASAKVSGPVTSLAWQRNIDEDADQILFVGCQTGEVHWFRVDRLGQSFTQIGHAKLGSTAIASIEWREQQTTQWRMPSLLVSQLKVPARLYAIKHNMQTGQEYLEIYAEFPPAPKKAYIRSSFCPIVSSRSSACIVTGSEGGTVYVYAYRPTARKTSPQQPQRPTSWHVNQFAGHAGIVFDVKWNCDESLLASTDQDGIVILWKRVQLKSPSTVAPKGSTTAPRSTPRTGPRGTSTPGRPVSPGLPSSASSTSLGKALSREPSRTQLPSSPSILAPSSSQGKLAAPQPTRPGQQAPTSAQRVPPSPPATAPSGGHSRPPSGSSLAPQEAARRTPSPTPAQPSTNTRQSSTSSQSGQSRTPSPTPPTQPTTATTHTRQPLGSATQTSAVPVKAPSSQNLQATAPQGGPGSAGQSRTPSPTPPTTTQPAVEVTAPSQPPLAEDEENIDEIY